MDYLYEENKRNWRYSDDTLQESILYFLEHYKDKSKSETLKIIYTICKRSDIKNSKRPVSVEIDESIVEELTTPNEKYNELLSFLNVFNSDYSEILKLYITCGYNLTQISEKMCINYETLKKYFEDLICIISQYYNLDKSVLLRKIKETQK